VPKKGAGTGADFIYAAASTTGHFYTSQLAGILDAGGIQTVPGTSVPVSSGTRFVSGDLNGDGFNDLILVPQNPGVQPQVLRNPDDSGSGLTSVGTITRTHSTNIADAALANVVGDS